MPATTENAGTAESCVQLGQVVTNGPHQHRVPRHTLNERTDLEGGPVKTGKIVALVFGCLCTLLGFALLTASVFLGWAYFQQSDEGQVPSPTQRYRTSGSALVSGHTDLFDAADLPRGVNTENVGRVLLRATSDDSRRELFIGIGPRDEVEKFLDGVARTEVTNVEFGPFRPAYQQIPGARAAALPTAQQFWSASSTGFGTQELRWDLQSGSWTVVVVNADASQGISVDPPAGARLGFLGPLALGVLIGAVVLLIIGTADRRGSGRSRIALMRDEYPPFRLDRGSREPHELEPGTPRDGLPAPGTP
ncbi:MAG: hypothetical protein EOP32_26295 [Rhodococcus sp. (in: high G+C Gram-positive bacteria)]|nr:MAG: hypothetical protein EOP32_26295 [Rhodococcus sp. (in: high G+C Gram-positive bacteria)]